MSFFALRKGHSISWNISRLASFIGDPVSENSTTFVEIYATGCLKIIALTILLNI